MTELQLLDLIDRGQAVFLRHEFPDLEQVDRHLQALEQAEYLSRVIRATERDPLGGTQLLRIFVVGGLTDKGRRRKESLRSA